MQQISNFKAMHCNKTKLGNYSLLCDYGYSLSSNHMFSKRAFVYAQENCLLFSRLSFQWYSGIYKRFLFTDSRIQAFFVVILPLVRSYIVGIIASLQNSLRNA